MKNFNYFIYVVFTGVMTYFGRYKSPEPCITSQGVMAVAEGKIESLPLPPPFQTSLTEEDYRDGKIPGPKADRGVPVYWKMQTYDSLTKLAVSCNKQDTLYIEHHLNAGLSCREEAYTLTIATKKALEVANEIACWWAEKRGLKAQCWNQQKFTVIRECERRGISFIILEPAFVDALNKDAPVEVLEYWEEYTTFVSQVAKKYSYKNVALLIGHEARDGGVGFTLKGRRYNETKFYSEIREKSNLKKQ